MYKTTMSTKNKRKYVCMYSKSKKNKNKKNEDSDEEEEYENDEEYEKKIYDVYEKGNHVYFRSEVSTKSVDKLSRILDKKLKDYQTLKTSCHACEIKCKPIYLHITSWGGELSAGFWAHDMISDFPIPIYTVIEGYAVSCGSLMSIAGKKRFITKNSHMLIHQLSSASWGTFSEMNDEHQNLEMNMEQIYKMYIDASGNKLSKKKLKDILKHDIYWQFDTCQKYGLVDELWTNKEI